MLTVTKGAMERLKAILLDHSSDMEVGLRLEMGPPGQLGIVLGREVEGDQVVEHDGLKVLLVAHELAELLQGTTLDFEETGGGLFRLIK